MSSKNQNQHNLVRQEAERLLALGFSCIPIGSNKQPIGLWKIYQTQQANINIFITQRIEYIALVGGYNDLEAIDFDSKNDLTGKLKIEFEAKLKKEGLFDKLVIGKSRSGGGHYYFKSKKVGRNQKLASRPTTEEERQVKGKEKLKKKELIETRGEGGYIVVAPSTGYELLKGDFDQLQYLTEEERDKLFEICRSFDQMPKEEKKSKKKSKKGKKPNKESSESDSSESNEDYEISTWDDYDQNGDIVEELIEHGWTEVREDDENIFLGRPNGESNKQSASFHKVKRIFYVFSTSTQFEDNKGIKPTTVYAILNHNGDKSAACKELYKKGYGKRKEPLPNFVIPPEKSGKKGYLIDDVLFLEMVQSNHFFKLRLEDGTYVFVFEAKKNVIREIEVEYIKETIINKSITNQLARRLVLQKQNTLLSQSKLECLSSQKKIFQRGTATHCYFYFKNGVAIVSEDKIELKGYGTLAHNIWESEINPYNFEVKNLDYFKDLSFYHFLHLVCTDKEGTVNEEKLEALFSSIGYLISTYKNPVETKAIVLCDEYDENSIEQNGRTGKGIIAQAIGHVRKSVTIDGKSFNPNSEFKYQSIQQDTRVVVLDDVKENFQLEDFFSVLTTGISINQKYKQPTIIPYRESPKFLITTNHILPHRNSDSYNARITEIELYKRFDTTRTPKDEYNELFFHDWSAEEWNKFYNLMLYCCQRYLQKGLKSYHSDSLEIGKLIAATNKEFMEFAESHIVVEKEYDKKKMFKSFLTYSSLQSESFKQRTLTTWVKEYAKYKGWEYSERRSNGSSFFKISNKSP